MSATLTVDDLQRLLDAVQRRDAAVFDDQDYLDRLEVFVATAIGVREAQKTRSGTGHHAQLMESYRAAHTKWLLDRENFSNGYPAEKREYEDLYPRPKLKDFMRGHRHPQPVRLEVDGTDTACPVCGAPLTITARAATQTANPANTAAAA